MNNTVFPTQSLDRDVIQWEQYLGARFPDAAGHALFNGRYA